MSVFVYHSFYCFECQTLALLSVVCSCCCCVSRNALRGMSASRTLLITISLILFVFSEYNKARLPHQVWFRYDNIFQIRDPLDNTTVALFSMSALVIINFVCRFHCPSNIFYFDNTTLKRKKKKKKKKQEKTTSCLVLIQLLAQTYLSQYLKNNGS